MAIAETKTTITQESTNQKQDIMSQIKWIFAKLKDKSKWKWDAAHATKAFRLTAKDATIALALSIAVVIWACVYGWITMNKYEEMNSRSDELKELFTYNVSLSNAVDPYTEWNSKSTINWVLDINKNIAETLINREEFKKEQKNYYEVLLQNIYLPSLNIWKNPYTDNFDESVMWQKYLDTNKFQDLYLIQHRSDFIRNMWNDAEYNTVNSISIWDTVEVWDSNYFYLPITVTFTSPNKRSFLLLVNKLSMTSNVNNISLVNEFFFYLLMNIKEKKSEDIEKLMQKYWKEFSSSSAREWPSDISDLTDEQRSSYQDQVIWYELYNWINYDGTWKYDTPLIDDELIVETIKENTMCDSTISDSECFYNFRDKYRNLPYIAYKIWMEKQSNRTNWFREFLKDLPSIIAITDFGFDKRSSSSFLNNEEEKYEWTLTFNAYWRTISTDELNEAADKLWNLCFGTTADQQIFPDIALDIVNESISKMWWLDSNVNINSLQELKWIFEELSASYPWMSNYNKMIKIFESWRMLNDANLCKY